MDEQKIDRRVRKTKKTLLHCLTQLMAKKKINNITVKELTDLADVNRSTFYLYYKDIFDMVEQIETEMLEDFKVALNTLNEETNDYSNWLSFYTYIFEYVKSKDEMCKILLGPDGDYSFIEKFKDTITETKPAFDDSVPEIKIHYVRPFIIAGCIGVVQQWLIDDMNVEPKDMAKIVLEMVPTFNDINL